jgi:hypothetical protein
MNYTVKNVKSFQGREGFGFACSLFLNEKKIGTVTDYGDGGCLNFLIGKNEKVQLDEYCKTLPPLDFDGRKINNDADIFVGSLVDAFKNNKKLKNLIKRKTVFKISEDEKGTYRVIGTVFDIKVKTYLENKYKDKGLEIINEKLR